MIYNTKSAFLAVNASLRWLNNVISWYLAQVSLLLIGQQVSVLLPIGWRIVQILRQHRRKTTNIAPATLSAIQEETQFTFINAQ
jgi:hypothetical protein